MKYKTRGNSSPNNKARVYFTCHPDDFDRHFERITDAILNEQNCVIWYTDPEETIDEALYYEQLAQMQLFVLPVTAAFLETENRARNIDYRYAAEHHKPVLPVMVESGLAAEFSRICGDRHIVDETSSDNTAKTYEELLSEFLKTVLIGDEQAEKIRSAFDTYIFLSYRKIDRAYAKELMKLIHKNDFCRDIAIWYDEFLIPGESFNSAIREALMKSPLFALNVTPSLLQLNAEGKPNYVMETEFPMAVKTGKVILPFEMVKTDREKMAVSFKGLRIDSMIDPGNTAEIERALKDAVKSIALSEKKKDTAHDFFIGLAYLGGIDVEVNTDRALKLITESAEKGLPEAIEKLSDMYYYGDVVALDREQALYWKEALADRRLALWTEDPSDENGSACIKAFTRLANLLLEMRLLENALGVCDRIASFCVDMQFEKPWAMSAMSWAYNKKGELYRLLGRYEEAEAYLSKDIEVLSQIIEAVPDDLAVMCKLGVALNNAGRTKQAQGAPGEAVPLFRRALELFESIDQSGSTLRSKRDIAATLGYLGNCYYLASDIGNVETCYSRMHQINKAILDEVRTPEAKRDYAVSCSKMGLTAILRGDPVAAIPFFLENEAVCIKLAEASGSFESFQDLSITYEYLRDAFETLGDLGKASEYGYKQVENANRLVSMRDGMEAKIALRKAYAGLAPILANLGSLRQSAEAFDKAITAGEEIIRQSSRISDHHALATLYYNMGMVTGDRSWYRKAYDMWKQLARSDARFSQHMAMAKKSLKGW